MRPTPHESEAWFPGQKEILELISRGEPLEETLTSLVHVIEEQASGMLELPNVVGLEVLRHIKGDDGTRTIPVVVLTSSKEESDRVESYDLGVNSYIVNPVDFDQFVEAVRMLGKYWLLLNEPPITPSLPPPSDES